MRLSLKIIIPSFIFIYGIKFLLITIFNLEQVLLLILITGILYLILFFSYTKMMKIDYIEIVKPLFKRIKFNKI